MEPQILEEDTSILKEYGQVPISFQVECRLEITMLDDGLDGFRLTEKSVKPSYLKDYDARDGEGPERWLKRWDLSNWGVLSAFFNGGRIGGAVIAYNTRKLFMLQGRNDIAALWDLRVHPDFRNQGVGSKLFQSVEVWARERNCRSLKIETQNTNVPACRFYKKRGCTLGSIDRFAYPDLPHEIQLIWYKELIE